MKTQLIVHPHELSRRWIDRAAELNADVIGLHPVGGDKARDTLVDMLNWLESDAAVNLIDYAYSAGLSVEYEIHAGSYLLPRELFATKPELFRLSDGKRTPDVNFCISENEALSIASVRAAELMKRLYRSTDNYYFWLDDVKNCACECEKCRELSVSDQNLTVMNALIREMRKVNERANLAYLAYFRSIRVPQNVKPEEGIFLEYAPFERNRKEYLDESATETELKPLLDFFGKKNAKILEYWYDNSMFSGWKYPPAKFVPNGDTIRREIEFYKRQGVEYISSFACYFGEDYIDLYGEPDLSDLSECKVR